MKGSGKTSFLSAILGRVSAKFLLSEEFKYICVQLSKYMLIQEIMYEFLNVTAKLYADTNLLHFLELFLESFNFCTF